jgi:hypothetical protein
MAIGGSGNHGRRGGVTSAFAALALVACAVAPAAPLAPQPGPAPSPALAAPAPLASPEPTPSAAAPSLSAAAPSPAPPASSPSTSAPSPSPAPQRLASRVRVTRVWPKPDTSGVFIGTLRVGRSVALHGAGLVGGRGCGGGFYAIEPRGYVCADGTVALEPDDRARALADAVAPAAGAFPYRYAISNGVPTNAEQARFERGYGPASRVVRLPKTLAAHEELATTEPIAPIDPMPPFFGESEPFGETRFGLVRQTIPVGSMLSFTRAFEAEGRTWLLSADETLVPADRVRAFRPSAFHGVRLGGDVELPIAWMRARSRPQQRRLASGAFEPTGGAWPARAFVRLTGAAAESGGARYVETRERDPKGDGALWVAAGDATVVEARTRVPAGVRPGQKWLLVSIGRGTLVAYEELRPVYATLISPGRGGQPRKGHDPVEDATTPTGVFYVTFKDRATTMSPDTGDDRTFWIADVPHTQYFDPPFALHAAYWHDRFGEPTSAGCVNLSPLDAEALFDWSDPKLPEGWQGVTGSSAVRENGETTAVVIVR